LSIDWSDKAITLCITITASISGIFSQLDATSVAEALENFLLITPLRRENLAYCPVWFCIQINNTLAAFFGCSEDGVR
jgi:hypothetical protein